MARHGDGVTDQAETENKSDRIPFFSKLYGLAKGWGPGSGILFRQTYTFSNILQVEVPKVETNLTSSSARNKHTNLAQAHVRFLSTDRKTNEGTSQPSSRCTLNLAMRGTGVLNA